MRSLVNLGLAVALAGSAATAWAAELKSGLQVGGPVVGAFNVVKCGGAAGDGVKDGQQLCYL